MIKKEVLSVAAAIMLAVFSTACGDNNDGSQVSSSLTDTEAVTTVEDTNKDITSIDPFEGLTVTFNGESGSGTVSLEYTGDIDFVRDKVRFNCDSPNSDKLSNGDVISVSARCTPKEQQENGYELSITEKEYTVSELSCYLKTVEEYYSFKDLDEQLNANFENDVFEKYCKKGDTISASKFDLKLDNIGSNWEIVDSSYALLEKDLFISECYGQSNSYNAYYHIYKINMTLKKVDNDSYYADEESAPIGTTKDVEFIGYISKEKLYYENHNSEIISDGLQNGSVIYNKANDSNNDIFEIVPISSAYLSGERFTIS